MIKKITINGFKKTANKVVDFEKNNIITGDNRTGKTTILEAIQFAILGEVNGYKKPGDIYAAYAMNGNTDIYVCIELECGINITRSVMFKKDKYSSAVSISGNRIASGKDAELIIQELGFNRLTFAFNELVSMTGTNRKKEILKLCGASDVAIYDVVNYVKFDEEHQDVYKDILGKISKLTAEPMDSALAFIDDAYKTANLNRKTDAAGAVKLSELKSQNKANIAKQTNVSNELEACNFQLQEQQSALATSKQMRQFKESKDDQLKNIDDSIIAQSNSAIEFEKEIETHKAVLSTLLESIESTSNKLIELEKDRESLKVEWKAANEEYESARNNYSKTLDLRTLSLKDVNHAVKTKADFEINSNCPITGNKCGDVNVVESLEDKVNELKNILSDLVLKLENEEVVKNKLKERLDSIESKGSDINDNIDAVKSEKEKLEQQKAEIESKISKKSFDLKGCAFMIENLNKHKKEIESKPIEGIVDEELAETIIENLQEQKKTLEEELSSIKEKLSLFNAQEKSLQDSEMAEIKFNVIKDIKDQIGPKGFQGEFINKKLDSLKNVINEVTLALCDAEFYFDPESKDFAFGLDFVKFESLSGYEQIVVSMAMIMALSGQQQLILIDEVNKVYEANFDKLIDVIGKSDSQFILAGAINRTSFEGFNVIKL